MVYVYFYWKRFAQSAGPRFRQRFAQSAGPLSRAVVPLMICLGSCLVEFCTTLKHFVDKVPPLGCFLVPFWTLGVIFGAILNPWNRFWSTLFTFFGVKKTLRRQRCPRSASKHKAAFRTHVLKLFWGSFLVIFQVFWLKRRCKKQLFF